MSTEQVPPLTSPPYMRDGGPSAVLVDLRALRARLTAVEEDETKERLRHAQEMAMLATRRANYRITLSVLEEEYPLAEATLGDAKDTTANKAQALTAPQSMVVASDTTPATKQNEVEAEEVSDETDAPRKRAKRGVLKGAIINLLTRRDTFLATDDFKKAFQEDPLYKSFSNKRITDSLKDARQPGQGVIGILVYVGAFPKKLNGLSGFYEDADGQHMKPEYADKLQMRLYELGMTLEKTAAGETKTSSLFPLDLRETSASFTNETAPVEAGAESDIRGLLPASREYSTDSNSMSER